MMKKAKKSLMAFVREQCANYQGGDCVGTGIAADLRGVQFREPGRCWLSEQKPCRYFERCVLGPASNPHQEPGYDYESVFEQYARVNPAYLTKTVSVRRCECGEPLPPRYRYCARCRRRREQQRRRAG